MRSNASVLLVDDRPENLLALEAVLAPLGHQLVRATSGEEALRHLLTRDFAVILLDVQMPGIDGFETAEQIKQRERTRCVPIIFLTALNEEARHVFRAYDVGAVDYMAKPFEPEVLRSKVRVFVELYQARAEAEEARRDAERVGLLNAQLAEIVESSGDAIFSATPQAVITSWNAGAARLFGYSADEAIGKSVSLLIPPDHTGEEWEILDQVMRGKSVERYETRRLCKAGDLVDVSLTVSPILDVAGGVVGVSAIAHDVTERKRGEVEIRRASEAAQGANRAKSEFLSRMSHELRTPLNSILGFGQLLELGELASKDRESVDQILKAGQHLLRLINEVLDVARIEAGRMSLSIEPVSGREVVEEMVDLVRPIAAQRGIELARDPGCASGWVKADHQRLKQVALNLLSNAVKYNREGGCVSVSWKLAGAALRFEVSDTGQGIAPDRVERLFSPFDRLGAEKTGIEGTGLGLALSKGLVEAMGGSMGVESTVGAGSTFWFELPAAENPLAEPLSRGMRHDHDGAESFSELADSFSGTILYIEDNLANLTLIERLLAHHSRVDLLSAMQGRIGLDLAHQHLPDLILLDLHLPDIPGQEVLTRLREDEATARIPVVILSADATPGSVEHLLELGADSYLTKPLDVRLFFGVLGDLLVAHPAVA